MTDGGRVQRRILHTSDLHLELVNDKACQSLEAVVNLAIKVKVDLVIIAGDFFDHNRVDDNLVSFTIEQLRRLPVSVVILPGNHDPLVPGSVYHRVELWKDAGNIRIFQVPEGETFTLPGLSVWGRPLTSYAGMLQPLAGASQNQGGRQWHIAVAHGYYVGSGPPSFSSYDVGWEEIVSSRQDYIALGHVAIFRCVCDEPVKAYYSGGPPICGTVNIVNLSEENGVEVTPCPL